MNGTDGDFSDIVKRAAGVLLTRDTAEPAKPVRARVGTKEPTNAMLDVELEDGGEGGASIQTGSCRELEVWSSGFKRRNWGQ